MTIIQNVLAALAVAVITAAGLWIFGYVKGVVALPSDAIFFSASGDCGIGASLFTGHDGKYIVIASKENVGQIKNGSATIQFTDGIGYQQQSRDQHSPQFVKNPTAGAKTLDVSPEGVYLTACIKH